MPNVLKSGRLNLLETSGPVQARNGSALPPTGLKVTDTMEREATQEYGRDVETYGTNLTYYTKNVFFSGYILNREVVKCGLPDPN